MTTFNRLTGLAIIIGMIALTAMLLTQRAYGEAPSGLKAAFATTSTATVGPQKPNVASTTVTVFGNETNCSARVISTVGTPIMLLFSNAMISSTTANPTALYGHTQAASTTVVYDSGQFGCGYVSAYAFSSTTITVSEF